MTTIGVPAEIKTDECRVAVTPAGVRELVEHGHKVLVQSGAGEGSAISDEDYRSQGARMPPDAEAVFGEAEMIVKVKEPQPDEVARLEAGTCSSRTCTWHPTPSSRVAWWTRARRAWPTRRSRTRAGGSRCWLR
jgi:NAD/NADP transhydrogenase alpha subunit